MELLLVGDQFCPAGLLDLYHSVIRTDSAPRGGGGGLV